MFKSPITGSPFKISVNKPAPVNNIEESNNSGDSPILPVNTIKVYAPGGLTVDIPVSGSDQTLGDVIRQAERNLAMSRFPDDYLMTTNILTQAATLGSRRDVKVSSPGEVHTSIYLDPSKINGGV